MISFHMFFFQSTSDQSQGVEAAAVPEIEGQAASQAVGEAAEGLDSQISKGPLRYKPGECIEENLSVDWSRFNLLDLKNLQWFNIENES